MKTENETDKVTSSFLNTVAKSSVQNDVNPPSTSGGWTTVSSSDKAIPNGSFSYNGHLYSLTTGSLTWENAEAAAIAAGGHLVSVNNAAEQDFLFTTKGWTNHWIGLTDSETAVTSGVDEGVWRWTDGSAVDYTHWANNQPDNAGSNLGEDYVGTYNGSGWNDFPAANWNRPGIIEITNTRPTFTTLDTVTTGIENHQVAVTFGDLLRGSDAIDDSGIFGSIASFVVKDVTSGTLTIDGHDYVANGMIPDNTVISADHPAIWTPRLNTSGLGSSAFTVVARDNGDDGRGNAALDSNTAAVAVKIDVAKINHAPTVSNGSTHLVTPEDTPYSSFTSTSFGFVDTDSNSLQNVIITTLPDALTGGLKLGSNAVTVNQSIPFSNIGQLTFTPAANVNGTGISSFQFKVQDDGGTANGGVDTSVSPNTVIFDIGKVDEIPTLTSFSSLGNGNKDVGISITFADLIAKGNEADADGTVDSFVVTAAPTNGTLRIFNDTTFADWSSLNNTIDVTHPAIFTYTDSGTGSVNAFNVLAKDNDNLPGSAATPVPVNIVPVVYNSQPSNPVWTGVTGYEEVGIKLPFLMPHHPNNTDLSVVMSGLPAKATVNAADSGGYNSDEGTIGLNSFSNGGMMLTPDQDFNNSSSFDLTVTAVAYVPGTFNLASQQSIPAVQRANVSVVSVNDQPTGVVTIANMGNLANDSDNGSRTIAEARVGDTLEVSNTLQDADGMNGTGSPNSATVYYDWFRTKNGVTTEVSNVGTLSNVNPSYILTAAEAGSKISVKASYTDDGGFLNTVNGVAPAGNSSTGVASNMNDTSRAPVITVEANDSYIANLLESDSGLKASGTLTANDLDDYDVSGTHDVVNVVVTGVTGVTNPGGSLTLDLLVLRNMLSVNPDPVLGTGDTVRSKLFNWSFDSGSETFDDLAVGASLKLDYTLELKDARSGNSSEQHVFVNVNGTAEKPALLVDQLPSFIIGHDLANPWSSVTNLTNEFSHEGAISFTGSVHKMVYGLTSPLSAGWATFDSATGIVSGTPHAADLGTYVVTVTAKDTTNNTYSTPNEFYIYVDDAQEGGNLIPSTHADEILMGTKTGTDTVTYADAHNGVTVSIAKTTAQVTGDGTDTLSNIDNIRGSDFNDKLTGNDGDNVLDGGLGADTLTGGLGSDLYLVDKTNMNADGTLMTVSGGGAAGDVIVEKAVPGDDKVLAFANYILPNNVEKLSLKEDAAALKATGNGLANELTGNTHDNVLNGGRGADLMIGSGGDDTYLVDNAADIVDETPNGAGSESIHSGAGDDTINSSVTLSLAASATVLGDVEKLVLKMAAGKINGTGNALLNTITGNESANVLDGGGDSLPDVLIGGDGDDTYIVLSGDLITEDTGGNTGTDLVKAGLSWSLAALTNVENLTLTGTGDFSATGNALLNKIIGNVGNNVIDGGAGVDDMIGGAGDDTYAVDVGNFTVAGGVTLINGDTVTEKSMGGTADVVNASSPGNAVINYALSPYIEKLNLLSGTPNTAGNYGIGNASNNTITGGAGNDTINGGSGIDSMGGGDGNDTYYVDNTADIVTEVSGGNSGSSDLVIASISYIIPSNSNVENLQLVGRIAQNGTGSEIANTITGNAGNNILSGLASDDILSGEGGKDTLIGGAGADTLTGGSLADVFKYEAVTDSPYVLNNTPASSDRITDFSGASGDKDKIDLKAIDAKPTLGDDAFNFIGVDSFTHAAGQLRWQVFGDDTRVLGDINGDANADFQIVLTGASLNLTASDFTL